MELLSWLITILVAALLLTFAGALLSLRRLPLGRRPTTNIYDRLGRPIGRTENPDYHENPGENAAAGPDTPPRRLRRRG